MLLFKPSASRHPRTLRRAWAPRRRLLLLGAVLLAAALALALPPAAARGQQSTQFNLNVVENDRAAGGNLLLKVEIKQTGVSPSALAGFTADIDYNSEHLIFQEAVSSDLQGQGYSLNFEGLDADPTSGAGSGAYVRVAAIGNSVGTDFGDASGMDVEDAYGTDYGTLRFTITEAGAEAGMSDLFVRPATAASSYFDNAGNDPEGTVRDVPVTEISNANGTPLPIELGAFTGHTDGQAAVLEWTTLSEKNNLGFYVEQKDSAPESTAAAASWKTVSELITGAGASQEARRYSHRVGGLGFGRYVFRLRQVDRDGGEEVLGQSVELEVQMNAAYMLEGAYPNPFRSRATVQFAVREAQAVTVELYNSLGQRVRVLKEGEVPGGETVTLPLKAGGLASGVYFVRLRGEDFAAAERVTLVR